MRSVIAITLIICIVSCQSMPFFPILVMMPMINCDYVIPYPHLKLLHVCLIFYMFFNYTYVSLINKRPSDLDGHLSPIFLSLTRQRVLCLQFKLQNVFLDSSDCNPAIIV